MPGATQDIAQDDAVVCPFTLKPISSPSCPNDNIPKEAIAVISKCGHLCTLAHLVRYLHDNTTSKAKHCPVCLESPIVAVSDAISASWISSSTMTLDNGKHDNGIEGEKGGIVSFRYGAISYHLWLHTDNRGNRRATTAMHRIALLLGMNVNNGLKIIHKGKIIYPDITHKDISPMDISKQILDISFTDAVHKRKKPSLIVMGLRNKNHTTNNTISTYATTGTFLPWIYGIAIRTFDIVKTITPRSVISAFVRGIRWVVHTTITVMGCMTWFVRSILFPPQTNTQSSPT